MINIQTAARRICERGAWQVSNLALQKLLYLAHMVHLGRGLGELVPGRFQAWDYGPVEPSLYHRVKIFGDEPILDVFYQADRNVTGSEARVIDEIWSTFGEKGPGELVAITHWDDGAWAKHYIPGQRGIVIPNADIIDEYHRRTR